MQCLEGKIGILNKASEVKYTNIISSFEEQTKLAAISVKTGIEANKISKEGYIATKEKYTKEFADEVAKELGTEAYKAPAEINEINKEGYTVVYYIDTEGNEQTNGRTYIAIWYTDNGLRSTLDRDLAIEKYSLTDLAMNKSVNQTVLVRAISLENYSSELSNVALTSSIDADGINEEIGDIKKSSFKNKGNEDGTSIKTINNRILPKEYQQVEYIESTGTQYIDTEITCNNNTKIEVQYQKFVQGNNDSQWIFGQRLAKYNNACGINYWSNQNPNYKWLAEDAIVKQAFSSSIVKCTFDIFNLQLTFIQNNNTIVKTLNTGKIYSPYTMFLFACNEANSVFGLSSIKCYSFKIYNKDVLSRNFIPCYSSTVVTDVDGIERPKDTIGMYDLVEGKFYTNQGTGTFKKGNDV